jgi:glucose-1-phosphate cytidylyltransferase
MKVVILAGGFGTRLGEYTDAIPKPMVTIGGKPIIWHIMKTYAAFGYCEFILALGYKSYVIKDYFLNYRSLNSDLTVDLETGEVQSIQSIDVNWKVSLVDTGDATKTGGRLKRLKSLLGNETFMLTYGDGLANIDLAQLQAFHDSHEKLVTVTSVRPSARFGELELDGDRVTSFVEKPQLDKGWINGGFFVIEPEFIDLIDSDQTMLEREPLESAAKSDQLMSFRHHGFWQCMDTKRDRDLLESMWNNGCATWAEKWFSR